MLENLMPRKYRDGRRDREPPSGAVRRERLIHRFASIMHYPSQDDCPRLYPP